jgi:hypothetical protein
LIEERRSKVSHVLKILIFALCTLFSIHPELWAKGKEILLENQWYYVLHSDGRKTSIVSSQAGGYPEIEIIFSPDSNYVVYTAANGSGWEGQGRDLYYCTVDGKEKSIIQSSGASISYLYWVKVLGKEYILFMKLAAGSEAMGHVSVYDYHSKSIVFDSLGRSLVRIGDTGNFLVSDYLFSWDFIYFLDLYKSIPKRSSFDSFIKSESDTSNLSCTSANISPISPELRTKPIGFIPAYWLHDSFEVSKYIDLIRQAFEFTRLSCLIPSPDGRFVAFSATGRRFTCNGLLDTEFHKTQALRFFLGTFDGQPCWSPNSKYVAFINPANSRSKFINVFSIDSLTDYNYPMIAQKVFECPADKYIHMCFSSDSDTLAYEIDTGFNKSSGNFTIGR